MTFHVDSEVGRLRQVILHRPGLELTRLTPRQRRRPALRRRAVGPAGPRGARRLRAEAARPGRRRCTTSPTCWPRRSTTRRRASSCRTGSITDDTVRAGAGRAAATSSSAGRRRAGSRSCLIGGVLKQRARPAARRRQPAAGVPGRRRLPARPAAQPPVPAGQLRLGLRRAVDQPDGDAGPHARDDQLAASTTSTRCSPPTRLRTSTTATTSGPTSRPRSRAATSSSSATAPS